MAEKDKSDLRRRAENVFAKKDKKTPKPHNEAEWQCNIQELQIHQIELEMQQEEIKRDRDEIKQSLDYWQTTFDSTADLFMLLDKDFRIIRANASTAQFLNLPLDQIIGQHCFRLLHGTNEPFVDCPLARLKTSLKHETAELYIKEKDTWLFISVDPILDENGKLKEVVHIIRDITERKKAEDGLRNSEGKFRVIFDNASDGILLADDETKIFYTGNNTACQMLGYSLEEIKNLGITDIHPKEDLPHVLGQFERQVRREITVAKDLPVKRKDGSVFYADVNTSSVTLAGRTYLLGIFRDVTERKKMEEEAQKRLQELEVFYKASVGREERIIELKKEIEMLKNERGK